MNKDQLHRLMNDYKSIEEEWLEDWYDYHRDPDDWWVDMDDQPQPIDPKVKQRLMNRITEVECKACKGSGTKHKPSGNTLVLIACDFCLGHGKISMTFAEYLKGI